MCSILEALQNAEYNFKAETSFNHAAGKMQLHNSIELLEKGYGLYEDIDEILGGRFVEDVPEKENNDG